MTANSLFNIQRVAQAARYSFSGLKWLVRNEAAFRQELALFAVLFMISFLLNFSLITHAIQISLMSLILLVEGLNTAIEKLVDRVSLDRHPLSGLVKDIGSTAVALSFIPLIAFWVAHALS